MVSAITQTPASGPLALRTAPPMSVAPTVTPGGVLCWALSRVGGAARSAASAIVATPKYNLLLMLMCAFLVVVMRAPVANGRSGNGRRKPRPSALPIIQPQSGCIRNGVPAKCGQGGPKACPNALCLHRCRSCVCAALPPPATAVTFCCGVVAMATGAARYRRHAYMEHGSRGTRYRLRRPSGGRQRRKNAHVRLQPGKHRFAAGRGRG